MEQKKKQPRFGSAWKDKKSDTKEMDDLWKKFVVETKDQKPDQRSDRSDQNMPYRNPTLYRPDTVSKPDTVPEFDRASKIDTVSDSDTVPEIEPTQQTRQQNPLKNDSPTSRSDTVAKFDTVSNSDRVSDSDRVLISSRVLNTGFTKVPNHIFDKVATALTPNEWAVYSRLYRLSYGFNRDWCLVGLESLSETTHIGRTVLRETLKSLQAKKLIYQDEIINTKTLKGTRYKICTGLDSDTVSDSDTVPKTDRVSTSARVSGSNTVSESDTVSESNPMKDHDHDDFKRHDHHQSEVMTIYSSITGNEWTKADQAAYAKIKHLSAEIIEQAIRVTLTRAPQRPGSLAYFIKEILAQAYPAPATRAQRKKELQTIIERIRTLNGGRTSYPPSEFAADVKDACAREGIVFDGELFNEMVG